MKRANTLYQRNLKNKSKKLLEDDKKIHLENARLHHELNNMKSVVRDNGIEVNRLAQYNRSSFMLEISGITFNKNKNVSNIIQKIVMLTKITGFDITQVDVAHRTSKRENALIMLFNKKSDRTNLFKLKKKFHKLQAHQLFQSTQLMKKLLHQVLMKNKVKKLVAMRI